VASSLSVLHIYIWGLVIWLQVKNSHLEDLTGFMDIGVWVRGCTKQKLYIASLSILFCTMHFSIARNGADLCLAQNTRT